MGAFWYEAARAGASVAAFYISSPHNIADAPTRLKHSSKRELVRALESEGFARREWQWPARGSKTGCNLYFRATSQGSRAVASAFEEPGGMPRKACAPTDLSRFINGICETVPPL